MQSLIKGFLHVTESAAIASLPWVGSKDKIAADGAATKTMRDTMNQMEMDARVVIGEGEIDEAPMLYIGERLGTKTGMKIDIAVDPIDGTTPAVNNQPNAITVLAAAPGGTLLHAPDMYMEKIAAGPKAKGKINIEKPLIENMKAVAEANGKELHELTVAVQDRDRHMEHIQTIKNAGASVCLFENGDIMYAAATCIQEANIDLFIGIGGAPEGVISAVAIKCLGGDMQARLVPRNDEEINRCIKMGLENPEAVLKHQQLVNADDCLFAATGITENIFLNGIKKDKDYIHTHSMFISGTEKKLQFITNQHDRAKLDHMQPV